MRTTKTKFKKNQNAGFTLLETLIVVALFTLLGLAVYSFQKDLWVNNIFVQNSIIAESEARGALRQIIAELRTATAGGDGSYAIGLASTTAITFFADPDKDGAKERLRYYVEGGNLIRGQTELSDTPPQYLNANESKKVLVHSLANEGSGIFTYYDGGYDATSSTSSLSYPMDNSKIRMVGVRISIDADSNRLPPSLTFQSQVMMRSLKDNN